MSFFKSIENFFSKVFTKAPSTLAVSLSVVSTVAPLAEAAMALVDPSMEQEAQPIITEVQSDLGVLSQTLKTGSTANVAALVASIQANLGSLLTAGHIKDPANVQKATALVNLISAELQNIVPAA